MSLLAEEVSLVPCESPPFAEPVPFCADRRFEVGRCEQGRGQTSGGVSLVLGAWEGSEGASLFAPPEQGFLTNAGAGGEGQVSGSRIVNHTQSLL